MAAGAPLRFAVLGAGYGADIYLPAIRACGHNPVLLASRSPRPQLQLEQTHDWRAALARSDIDAVVIVLPPVLQREAVEMAAASGRAVLCEKPAGLDVADAEAMLRAVDQAGICHAVGFQFRYEPAFAELKRRLAAGAVGHIEHLEVDWCVAAPHARMRPWSWRNDAAQGGGIVMNFATHAVDYVRWLSGQELELIGCSGRILVPERKDSADVAHSVSAPDSCDILLAAGKTAVASLRICNIVQAPLGHRVLVRGDCGTLELLHKPPFRDVNLTLTQHDAEGSSVVNGPDLGMTPPSGDSRVDAARRLLEAFIARIEGRPSDCPTLRDSFAVHAVLAGRSAF